MGLTWKRNAYFGGFAMTYKRKETCYRKIENR